MGKGSKTTAATGGQGAGASNTTDPPPLQHPSPTHLGIHHLGEKPLISNGGRPTPDIENVDWYSLPPTAFYAAISHTADSLHNDSNYAPGGGIG